MKNFILIVFLVFIFYSCSPKIVPQPTKDIKDNSTSDVLVIEELKDTSIKNTEIPNVIAEGKMLFENNCGNCHKLNNPKDYTPQQWLPILSRMQKEANLTDIEHDNIYAYLSSN